jgi:AcrR family transcriptional regulator
LVGRPTNYYGTIRFVSRTTDGRAQRGDATKRRILDAARDVLVEHGYAGTSTRVVAERAGTQLSLVHYHFGGKQQLLSAVLERQNTELLERQRALYDGPGPLSEKWRVACDFLDEDLRSGFVRALWELWAAGLSEPELAARWREAMGGWRELLIEVFAEWAAGLDRAPPLPPRVLGSLAANIFQGIEIELLAGVTDDESPHREALAHLGALIERAEEARGQ